MNEAPADERDSIAPPRPQTPGPPVASPAPAPDETEPLTAGPFDFLARNIAQCVLAMPRYSWVRAFQPAMRRITRQQGGRFYNLTTADGLTLEAAHLPANPDAPRRLPVFYVHGYLETKEVHLREAMLLARRGHDVFLYDQRAHGRSQGKGMTFGVRERHDLAAVIDHAQQQGWIDDRIITMGFSLGGAVVIQHAPHDTRVQRVVSLAPFADATASIRSFHRITAPFFRREWVERGFNQAAERAGFLIEEASTLEAIRQIEVPVLLIVGTRDKALPARQHTHVLAAAKEKGEIKVIEVDNATHIDLCTQTRKTIDTHIANFCATTSPNASAT